MLQPIKFTPTALYIPTKMAMTGMRHLLTLSREGQSQVEFLDGAFEPPYS